MFQIFSISCVEGGRASRRSQHYGWQKQYGRSCHTPTSLCCHDDTRKSAKPLGDINVFKQNSQRRFPPQFDSAICMLPFLCVCVCVLVGGVGVGGRGREGGRWGEQRDGSAIVCLTASQVLWQILSASARCVSGGWSGGEVSSRRSTLNDDTWQNSKIVPQLKVWVK